MKSNKERPKRKNRKVKKTRSANPNMRLFLALLLVFICIVMLVFRIAYLQIFRGQELKVRALEQWSKKVLSPASRGIIYDNTGKKLVMNTNGFSVSVTPNDIKDKHQAAIDLSEILGFDEEEMYKILTSKKNSIKIVHWVEKEVAEQIKELNIRGVHVSEATKRNYINGSFASHILGSTNADNNGQAGIELTYNKELSGIPGVWFKMTDVRNQQLPTENQKQYDSIDGYGLILTIDEKIQYITEKAAEKAKIENEAKSVTVIVMEPKTGDVLAMTTKPDYNPNNPKEPVDEAQKNLWAGLSQEDLQKEWFQQWRNPAISDIYEPGSTYKLINTAAVLEENKASLDTHYYCGGTVTDIPNEVIKCARWYAPHGDLTFREAVNESCNVAFVAMGRQLGKEDIYRYSKAFGFGEKTYIDLSGEELGLLPPAPELMKEIHLATVSYGHGIAVTPIQLIRAVSAVVNGGYLMKPRIVKEFVDNDINVVEEIKPEVVRQVISEETSETMRSLMETVVSEGSGAKAKIPGYRIGGKTGTAQKVAGAGQVGYAENKYIASFVGAAPIQDPQFVVLVIVDEPMLGRHYGGTSAAPVAKEILEEIFKYKEIEPSILEEVVTDVQNIDVPDVTGLTIGEAGRRLANVGLRYSIELSGVDQDAVVVSHYPEPWSTVPVGTIIDLKIVSEDTVDKDKVPFISGKTTEEAINILENLGINYQVEGEGELVIKQYPLPNEALEENTVMQLILGTNTE